jgi:hypothetical protein
VTVRDDLFGVACPLVFRLDDTRPLPIRGVPERDPGLVEVERIAAEFRLEATGSSGIKPRGERPGDP